MANSTAKPLAAPMIAVWLGLAMAVAAPMAHAVDAAGPLLLCMDEQAHPPFILADGGGTIPALLNEAGRAIGVQVDIHRAPLLRCMEEIRQGIAHGYTSGSPHPGALAEFRFPMAGGKPDASRAIARTRHAVFRRVGDAVQWDGKRFSHVQRAVLVPTGLEGMQRRLNELQMPVDLQAKRLDANFDKLLAGRGDAVVAFENDGLELLRDPRYAGRIEALPTPFFEQDYYLMVSQAYYAAQRPVADAMWQEIARINKKK